MGDWQYTYNWLRAECQFSFVSVHVTPGIRPRPYARCQSPRDAIGEMRAIVGHGGLGRRH